MIVRTETYRDLEEDIATVCDCVGEYIYEKLSDFDQYINNCNYDEFNKLIEQFVEETANLSLVDDIYIYHLARHFDEPTELLPLKDLLITKNSFSDFLAENDIVFRDKNGNLEFYYKTNLIDPQKLVDSSGHCLLARRLGYLGEADSCINGFTFWPDIEKTSDGYYKNLRWGSEFVGCIGRYLGIDLRQKYIEKTNYYGIVFKVPIDEVIFDGRDYLKSRDDKIRYLLKYSLKTLHGCYFHSPSSTNNPILRIDDKAKVKVDHCILIKSQQI